jgi:predicted HicB family RNase H-like nuclease
MKSYKGYLAGLYVDEEKAIIRGKALNTRDTITFYGKTVEEALQAFRDSVDDYLDFCKEAGVEPDKPFNGKLLIRIKPEHHRDLSLIAQEQGRSINFLVAQLVIKEIRARASRIRSTLIPSSEDEGSSDEKPAGRAGPRSSSRTRQGPPSPGSRSRVKAK